jgi:hypothetical protein
MIVVIYNPSAGVERVQVPPRFALKTRKGKDRFRTQAEWLMWIRPVVIRAGCEFFAFRHGGRWHLCDAAEIDSMTIRKSIDGGSYKSAEMWVMMKEEA